MADQSDDADELLDDPFAVFEEWASDIDREGYASLSSAIVIPDAAKR